MKCYYDGEIIIHPKNIASVHFQSKPMEIVLTNGDFATTAVVRVFLKTGSFVTIPVATVEAGNKKMEEIKGLMEQE